MASLNQCTFLGNLTRDPEVKYTPKGTAVATIGLALNHVYTNSQEEKVEEVCFIDCEAWGRTAEIAQEYLRKGNLVLIVGRLKLDEWEDKETQKKRTKHRVVVERLQLMPQGGGKAPSDDKDPRGKPADYGPRQQQKQPTQQQQKPQDPDNEQPEDDIPF